MKSAGRILVGVVVLLIIGLIVLEIGEDKLPASGLQGRSVGPGAVSDGVHLDFYASEPVTCRKRIALSRA